MASEGFIQIQPLEGESWHVGETRGRRFPEYGQNLRRRRGQHHLQVRRLRRASGEIISPGLRAPQHQAGGESSAIS